MRRAEKGFILQDALLALLIVCAAALIVLSVMRQKISAEALLSRHKAQIEDEIRLSLGKRKECLLCSEDENTEEMDSY